MSNDKLFIPEKCKAGFNLRSDTYSGRLAYVIYHDGKVWRKENSWESWRQKEGEPQNSYDHNTEKNVTTVYGPEVAVLEFDNVPTSGFVLNRKVGGGNSSGWNHRNTYCRVWDPRGFEIEVSINNLLFILQETDSMRGKGLSGEFVYSWFGKDLVLLSCESEDYKKSKGFTELQHKKISAKDLIKGATYKTKKYEEVIYLGRYDYYDYEIVYSHNYESSLVFKQKKSHIFSWDEEIIAKDSASFLGECIDVNCSESFSRLLEKFQTSIHASELVSVKSRAATVEDLKIDETYPWRKQPAAKFNKNKERLEVDWDNYSLSKFVIYSYFKYSNSFLNLSSTGNLYYQQNKRCYDTLEEFLVAEQPEVTYFITKNGNEIINTIF